MPTTPEQLAKMQGTRPVSQYRPGQIMFYLDHRPMGLWLLLHGEVILRGRNQQRTYVTAPAVLGLAQLQSEASYPATAQATTACEVVFIGKEELGTDLAAFTSATA